MAEEVLIHPRVEEKVSAGVEDEEGEMSAQLRQVIEAEELRTLGPRVEAFKKGTPTRPHPAVPNKPLRGCARGPWHRIPCAPLVPSVPDALVRAGRQAA